MFQRKMKKVKQELFFVYGTLKSTHHNNRILEGATFVGHGITEDEFAMVGDGCPFVFKDHTRHQYPVVGEVYSISNEETVRRLDRLEGVSHGFYERIEVWVVSEEERYKCWMYTPTKETINGLVLAREVKPTSGLLEW